MEFDERAAERIFSNSLNTLFLLVMKDPEHAPSKIATEGFTKISKEIKDKIVLVKTGIHLNSILINKFFVCH